MYALVTITYSPNTFHLVLNEAFTHTYSATDLLRPFTPKMFTELPSLSGPAENQTGKATAHGTTSRGGTDITHVRPVKIPRTIAGIRSSAGRGGKLEGPWLTWTGGREGL